MLSYEDALAEVIRALRDGRVGLFCGAGVSLRSGIPLAATLREHLLAELGATQAESERILRARLPFEVFMERITEEMGGTQHERLLDIFRCGAPNSNHLLVARLARAGMVRLICTTNFDLHIERALENGGLEHGHHFHVHAGSSDAGALDDVSIRVIKLHGSVDQVATIGLTLRAICAPERLAPRVDLIRRLFTASAGSDAMLVLGYSFSDLYDVVPGLNAVTGKRRKIYVVQHTGEPARRVTPLPGNRGLSGFDGFCIETPFDTFATEIWTALFADPVPTDGSLEPLPRNLENWRARLAFGDVRARSLSNLLFTVSDHTGARKRAQEFERSARSDQERISAALLVEAATGRLRSEEGGVLPPDIVASMANQSEVLALQGGPTALAISAQLGTGVGMNLMRIGALDRAMQYHQRALERAVRAGARDVEALCWLNLSATVGSIGDTKQSEDLFRMVIRLGQQAIRIYADVESPFHEGRCHMNIGNAHHVLSEYELAHEAFVKARARFLVAQVRWHDAYLERKLAEVQRRSGGRF